MRLRTPVLEVQLVKPPATRKYGRIAYCMFFLFASLVVIIGMQARRGVELADDGAFFLRYAENMQSGHFWIWNVGEQPIWGASAPLYPLVLAFLMKLGVPALATPVVVGFTFSTGALAMTATALARYFGLGAGLLFIALAALDSGIMYQSASGMETPLTFLLLAVGVLALLRPFPGWIIGAIAGLLVVNKLDLVPFAAFLVLAYWVRFRKFPFEAVCISSVIGLAWYGFAQLYFGSLVPNSFVTKALHQDNLPHNIDWTWFGRRTFLGTPPWAGPELFPGTHAWALLLALLGMLLASNKWRPLYIYLLGGLLIHFIVYTAKPPFEPYDWYTMPSTLALYILAAVGFSNVLAFLNKRLEIRSQKIEIFSTIILIAALWLVNLQHEKWQTTTVKFFVAHEEVDRAEAGRWVDRNVPQHFRIMTFWGNAAYHSHRQTIDASFLNRDIRLGLPRGKESAEVIITVCRGGGDPSECANQLVPLLGEETASTYITVRVFDKHFSTGVSDYFYVVLVRHDVLHELRSIGVPLGLHMRN